MRALLVALALAQIIRSETPSTGGTEDALVDVPEATVRAAYATFGVTTFSGHIAWTGSGTAAAVTRTDTAYGRFSRTRRSTTASTNSIAYFGVLPVAGRDWFLHTSTATFTVVQVVGFPSGISVNGRAAMIGVTGSTSAPSGSTNPSAQTNCLYIGFDPNEATWMACSNDGAGTATCSDTGVSRFAAAMYRVTISRTKGGPYKWALKTLDSATADVSGTFTGDQPAADVQLQILAWTSNRTVAAILPMELSRVGIVTQP